MRPSHSFCLSHLFFGYIFFDETAFPCFRNSSHSQRTFGFAIKTLIKCVEYFFLHNNRKEDGFVANTRSVRHGACSPFAFWAEECFVNIWWNPLGILAPCKQVLTLPKKCFLHQLSTHSCLPTSRSSWCGSWVSQACGSPQNVQNYWSNLAIAWKMGWLLSITKIDITFHIRDY